MVPGLTLTDEGRGRRGGGPCRRRRTATWSARSSPIQQRKGIDASADALAHAVDLQMRANLAQTNTSLLVGKMPGQKVARRSVAEAWLQALTATDPLLPATLSSVKVGAFADDVMAWIRTGAASQDADAGGVAAQRARRSADQLAKSTCWSRTATSQAWSSTLPSCGRPTRRFPLVPLPSSSRASARSPDLRPSCPGYSTAPDRRELTWGPRRWSCCSRRVAVLTDAGIGLNLPGWWSQRQRVRLRAKATTKRSSAGTAVSGGTSGFGFDQMVSFTWEAALGETELTAKDLRDLEQAAATKQSLVRVRGEWVELDPTELAAMSLRWAQPGRRRPVN